MHKGLGGTNLTLQKKQKKNPKQTIHLQESVTMIIVVFIDFFTMT